MSTVRSLTFHTLNIVGIHSCGNYAQKWIAKQYKYVCASIALHTAAFKSRRHTFFPDDAIGITRKIWTEERRK
jgi:hypothetical protein